MRLSRFNGVALAACFVLSAFGQDDVPKPMADVPPVLKIGSQAPDFSLPGVDGKSHSLGDYAASKVLVIVFTCDHCPVAQMYEKRIKALAADYRERGATLVGIMGNDPKAVHLSEMGYTDLGDSFPEMKLRAAYRQFNFPYLFDGATQAVALKYGPTATPHVFVFDQQRILRYTGRIDNNARETLVTKHEAQDAIEALLNGKPVPVETRPAVGCSTKWAYKEAGAKAEMSQGEQEPVRIGMASTEDIQALRKNMAGKLLLVNFWATWCEPCMAEFPEIEKMIRMYRKRQLEIVTVSINNPDEKSFVQKFLDEQHAIGRNLLLDSNDPADAVKAFNADWAGGVPFTALIGTDGNLLYKTQGSMDVLALKRMILKYLPDDKYLGQNAYWNSSF
jgi:peroxiredoxin